ncbi:MAG TPA: tetratricopeptide repeat protein [Xanthobacteraceae bacterium]|nr:tetratricopeptide repeat protein [Xanthobacteraceae bacterium]
MNRQERRKAQKLARAGKAQNPAIRGSEPEDNNAESHHSAGSNFLAQGRLAEAEHHYRRAIALRPNYAEAHNNLGIILKAQGKLEDAKACFERTLAVYPNAALVHYNLGNVLAALRRPADAIASLRRAIELDPGHVGAYNNLSIVLSSQHRQAEAEDCCRRALALDPNNVEAHISLGNVLKGRGRLEQSTHCYQRALALRPNSAEALNNLGAVLLALGNLDGALECCNRAISCSPRLVDAHVNVGKVLVARGNASAAVAVALRALELARSEDAKAFFVGCLSQLASLPAIEGLRPAVLQALAEKWGPTELLAKAGMELVKGATGVVTAAQRAAHAWPERLSKDDLLGPSEWMALAQDQILRQLLQSIAISDPDLERLLGAARFVLLESALAASEIDVPSEPCLAFFCAIARQCFINEYIFDASDRETAMARQLHEDVLAALRADRPLSALRLIALAAYTALHSLPGIEAVLTRSWPAGLGELLSQQVEEPVREFALRNSIPRLTTIDDEISLSVRRQYEENPYPRWVHAAAAPDAPPLAVYLRSRFPLAPLLDPGVVDGLEVLVAGCGTGRQSIGAASRYRDARILAIDLSLASLCYAQRKTRELGIANIDYGQADILELGALGRSFHVIESIGVLHHLHDPFAGWRVLLSLLRPGGLMFLGLYSDLARQEIVEARRFLAERGFGTSASEIRRARRELAAFEGGRLIPRIAKSPDYYNTSGCRDLLFHARECRLTLQQIAEFLAENGLTFIGFDELPPQVACRYRERFADDRAMTDLRLWGEFEADNPDTFQGMYQFWVQKR